MDTAQSQRQELSAIAGVDVMGIFAREDADGMSATPSAHKVSRARNRCQNEHYSRQEPTEQVGFLCRSPGLSHQGMEALLLKQNRREESFVMNDV